ncbi:MAG: DMT family transporter [Actinomycetota bacterium]
MRSRAGYLELVLLGVLWGSIGVIVKHVTVSATMTAEVRLAVGFLAVFCVLALSGKLRSAKLRERGALLIADGIVLAFHWVMMFEAFKRLSVATAILLVFVGPVFVAVLVGPILKERVERRTIASLALSVGGMVLIALPAWRVQDPLGVVFALLSALGFSAVMLMGKRLTETYKPQEILVWQLGVGALAVLPFALASGSDGLLRAMPQLGTLGLIHTALAGFVYFGALKVVKAQHVGVLTYLEPATAIGYAWIFLKETPSASTLIGGLLIMAGGLNIVLFARQPVMASPEEAVGSIAEIKASLEP